MRELRDFVVYNRDILIMLEEAYTEVGMVKLAMTLMIYLKHLMWLRN
ncbi:hypothetical protein [Vulcanisaeta souniana]|nr:hypothetical protein [Vulcanisaeta souniana]